MAYSKPPSLVWKARDKDTDPIHQHLQSLRNLRPTLTQPEAAEAYNATPDEQKEALITKVRRVGANALDLSSQAKENIQLERKQINKVLAKNFGILEDKK